MKILTTILAAATLACVSVTFAADTPACCASVFQDVPPAEIPSRTAKLIKSSKDAKASVEQIVKAAVAANPAAAPAIVGAVAKAVPSVAAVAAGVASAEHPAQAQAIAKAAATAAPSKAGAIVAAVCRAAPNQVKAIANAVLQAAPKEGKAILAGVGSAIPSLQAAIEQAMASYKGSASVNNILEKMTVTQVSAADPQPAPPIPPTVGPPFVQLTANPGTVAPSTGVVQEKARNYAAP